MDSDQSAFDIQHSVSPPVDLAIDAQTVLADITPIEPFDLRFGHAEVV